MSSEPLPQGFYLLVKYHGEKSVRCFSDVLTPAASSVFRHDLTIMGFPHPKAINTLLAPDATIVAWWPGKSRRTHNAMCTNLKNSTNAASRNGHLSQLSIALLLVQEMEAGLKNPVVLASASQDNMLLAAPPGPQPPAKRPRLDDASQNASQSFIPQQPQVPLLHPESPASASQSTAVTTQNVSRPFTPQQTQVPQVHPGPPVPAPQITTGTTSTAQKRTWDGQIIPSGLPAKPSAPSGVLLPQQKQVLPPTQPRRPPTPTLQAAAAATSIQPTHNLPPKPSLAPLTLAQKPSATKAVQPVPNAQAASAAVPASNAPVVAPQTQPVLAVRGGPATQSATPTPQPASASGPVGPLSQALKPQTTQNGQSTQPAVPVAQSTPVPQAPPAQGSVSQTTQNHQPTQSSPVVPQTKAPQTPSAPRAMQQPLENEEEIKRHRSTLVELKSSLHTLLSKDKMAINRLKKLGDVNVPAPMKLVDEVSFAAKNAELEALRKRVRSMEEMVRTQMNVKVRLDETANKLKEEQESRKELEETVAAAREGEADAKRRLEEVQKLLDEEGHRRSEADDLLAATRRDATTYREMCDRAKYEREESARGYTRAMDDLRLSRDRENAIRDERDRATQKLERTEQALVEETNRRRRYQDRLDSAEGSEAVLKQRCDELTQQIASLTRARSIDAHNARATKQRDEDALRLHDEKLRTQQIVIRQVEDTLYTVQASEETLKHRLEEAENRLEEVEISLEAELEAEKSLRREAEDAIADIRRECREPFVVPSLLDAFVELAKLTTRATTPGEGKGKEADNAPATMNSATDVASGGIGIAVAGRTAHEVHKQRSPLTPHFSPQSSPEADTHIGSASNQAKAEQISPTWD